MLTFVGFGFGVIHFAEGDKYLFFDLSEFLL